MTLTLRARLAVASTIVFGLLVTGLSFTTYRVLAARLDADATARLVELSRGLHGYLRVDGDTLSVAFDPSDRDQAAFVHDATEYCQVYDSATGRLLAESNGLVPLGLQLTPADVRTLLRRPQPVDVETPYGRFRFTSSAGALPDGRAYLLQVGVALRNVDATLSRYRALLLWRVPLVLLVAVAAFWWLAQFALLPLSKVASVADTIDVNSLDIRVPVRGVHDELDRVAESFNQTLARLAKAVGEMRQFSSALAHELRTPLAVLRGQGELSMRAPETTGEQRDRFATQIEEIDRLTRMIDRVLTLARAESGQVQLTIAPVDLGALASSLVEQLQPLAEARSISMVCDPADSVVVNGDEGWLERLLLNLLDNALRYTGPDGLIEVRVSRTPDVARIDVRDTGVGLAPEDAARVFEKFFRADPTRASDAEGAGLGLSLVEWIAVRHHGSVGVESRLGQGSTFSVMLPLRRG